LVSFVELDLSNIISILNFQNYLTENKIEIQLLINNAGIFLDGWNPSVFEETMNTNFRGTLLLTEHLLPYISFNSHIINISSGYGRLHNLSENYAPRISSAKTCRELIDISKSFDPSDSFMSNNHFSCYKLSKALLNRSCVLLLDNPIIMEKQITVNALCPGWVRTDMGGQNAYKSVEEAGQSVLWLIEQHLDMIQGKPSEIKNGQFYYYRNQISYL